MFNASNNKLRGTSRKKDSAASSRTSNRISKSFLRLTLMLVCIITFLMGAVLVPETISRAFQEPRNDLWQFIDETSLNINHKERAINPQSYKAARLNQTALKQLLNQAPMEFTEAAMNTQVEIALPMPDGELARFNIVESPIMELGLAAQFPEIKTYRGQRLDDRTVTMRCDWTEAGFHAIVLSNDEAITIEPAAKGDAVNYITYSGQGLSSDAPSFNCAVQETAAQPAPFNPNFVSGATLRTFRLALALTAEYTQTYGGGTVSGGLSAATIAVNSTNATFEKEAAIRLILVANESAIIFTNTTTDGYTHGDRFTMLNENQTRLDAVIGSTNYDIGHVFDGSPSGGNGGAGVAAFGVCVNGQKGRAATIFDNFPPTNPSLILATGHEMGHQFGAFHIFNGTTDTCFGNRQSQGAYEPGSGSTIMSYSGLCGSENLPTRDNYYHTASMQQIIDWSTTGSGGPCAGQIATGNHPPEINAGADYMIPKNTPFKLTATGSDTDGDALTYDWEELDLAQAQAPPNNDADGQIRPIFRSYPPTTAPSRMFPSLQYILNNANVPPTTPFAGEVLPAITRTMNFQVTARDNRSGGGGVRTDLMQVNVKSDSGPFLVTQPNTAITWTGGTAQTVTWSVNNTNLSPVNCANVKISLSTDGGNTFPIVLAASTPNDGSESIIAPNIITNQARVKVEAVGNIFFDISNASFTLTPSGTCPVINNISQSIGNVGTSIIITGANFNGVNAVKFANNVAASFTINSNAQITTTVPASAMTGPITISKTGCSDVQTRIFTISGSPPSDLLADNSISNFGCLAIGNPGTLAYYVNRLTPASYPATLTSVSIYFPNCGISAGTSLEIVVGVNKDGDTNINNTTFQTTPVTVQVISQFNTYLVPNVTINSGDFIVGFRITTASGVFPAPYDGTNPHNRRSYVSDGGTTFFVLDDALTSLPGNFGIRARVYSGAASCPSITSISPTLGSPGTVVTITGANLLSVTQMKFSNNVSVSFNIDGDTQITTTVPNGATTGPITLKSNCSDAQTGTFTIGSTASGTNTIGLFRPAGNSFFLRNTNTTGPPDIQYAFGAPGDRPVIGDWDGDGVMTVSLYRPSTSTFFLRNSNSLGPPDIILSGFGNGPGGDIPIAGDWNGDGTWSIGVFRPSTSTFFLRNSNTLGAPEIIVSFGNGPGGDLPLVGDWDGNGTTTIGIYRPSTNSFFLLNTNALGPPDIQITFGAPGDMGIAGDWDGNGTVTVGLFRPSSNTFFLRNTNTLGPPDITISNFGAMGDQPIVGDWDGL